MWPLYTHFRKKVAKPENVAKSKSGEVASVLLFSPTVAKSDMVANVMRFSRKVAKSVKRWPLNCDFCRRWPSLKCGLSMIFLTPPQRRDWI